MDSGAQAAFWEIGHGARRLPPGPMLLGNRNVRQLPAAGFGRTIVEAVENRQNGGEEKQGVARRRRADARQGRQRSPRPVLTAELYRFSTASTIAYTPLQYDCAGTFVVLIGIVRRSGWSEPGSDRFQPAHNPLPEAVLRGKYWNVCTK